MSEEHHRRRRRRRRDSRDEDLDSEDLKRLNQDYGWPSEHSNDHFKELSWWYSLWRSCVTLWRLCHAVFGNFVALVAGLSSCVRWPMTIIIVGLAIIIISLTVAYIAHRCFDMTEVAGMTFANLFAISWGRVSSGFGMLGLSATESSYEVPPLLKWHLKPILPTVDLFIPGLRALQRNLDVINVEYELGEYLLVPLSALEELDKEINTEYNKTLEAFDSVRHQLHNIIFMPEIEPGVSNPTFYDSVSQWVQGKRPSDVLRRRCETVISAIEALHASHQDRHKLIGDNIRVQMGRVATDVCKTTWMIRDLEEWKPTLSANPSIPGIMKHATLEARKYCHIFQVNRTILIETEYQLMKDHRAIAELLSYAKLVLANLKGKTDLQEQVIEDFQDQYELIARMGLDSMKKFYEIPKA